MDCVSNKTINCPLTFFLFGKLTETKSFNQLDSIHTNRITSGAISIAIDQNVEMADLATTGEEITEFMLSGSPWDIADED